MTKLPKRTSLLFLWSILRKNWVMKLIFCMQISIKLSYIDWNGQLFPKFPKCKLQFLYNISKMKLEVKLIFCMQISTKVSCRLISVLWASKFPTSWCYHYWWAWSNILKVLNITNLQYLNWIRDGVHFLHAGKP